MIAPTRLVEYEIEEIEVDGVKMIFQDTPYTEAPTEMNTYIPAMKALWMAPDNNGVFERRWGNGGIRVAGSVVKVLMAPSLTKERGRYHMFSPDNVTVPHSLSVAFEKGSSSLVVKDDGSANAKPLQPYNLQRFTHASFAHVTKWLQVIVG